MPRLAVSRAYSDARGSRTITVDMLPRSPNAIALVLVLGCADRSNGEGGGSATGGDSSTSTSTTTSTSTSAGSQSGTGTSASSADVTGSAATSASDSTASATSTSDSSGTGGAFACTDATDDCMICLGEMCCPELEGCTDPSCVCPVECMGTGGSVERCLDLCFVDGTVPFDAVVQCALAECSDADECPNVPN